jgi:hypothetical protein
LPATTRATAPPTFAAIPLHLVTCSGALAVRQRAVAVGIEPVHPAAATTFIRAQRVSF